MLRESYLLDTLECGDFSFATACLLANRKYGKNTQHGDMCACGQAWYSI